MSRPFSLSITIPAFNEEENIHRAISRALQAAASITNRYEILVVDDGSTDRTGTIANEWAARNTHVKTVHHQKNQGFSGAIKTCFSRAHGDLVFLLPADGQVDVFDIKRFIEKIDSADVVVGYRMNNPEPLLRRINSIVFHVLFRTLFHIRLREISTATLWKKEVLKNIPITSNPRSALAQPELILKAIRAGYHIKDVGIPYYKRTTGTPKGANPQMIFATIKEMWRLWHG